VYDSGSLCANGNDINFSLAEGDCPGSAMQSFAKHIRILHREGVTIVLN
jgi:hypothetical protein